MFKMTFKPLIFLSLSYKTIPQNNHLSEYLNGLLHTVPALFKLLRKQCTRRQMHLKPLARFLNEPISSLPALPAVFWGYCFHPEHGRQHLSSCMKCRTFLLAARENRWQRKTSILPLCTQKDVSAHFGLPSHGYCLPANPALILHFMRCFHVAEASRIRKQMIQFCSTDSYPKDIRKGTLCETG